MRFSVVGTGNMAWFLAKTLSARGLNCTGIFGRNRQQAALLATLARTVAYPALQDIEDADDSACIIAVSDSAISGIAAQLNFQRTVLIHSSGAAAADILSESRHYAVLWPVYSIAKDNLPDHRQIPIAWQASSEQSKEIVLRISGVLSDISFEATDLQRRWMHLSAVFGNNFINHMMALMEQICKDHHIPFSYLVPLLQQTFQNSLQQSPELIQTGPARRHDHETMSRHMHLLDAQPVLQDLYKTISASIEKMYPNNKE